MCVDVVAASPVPFTVWEQQQRHQPAPRQRRQPTMESASREVTAGAKLFTSYACQSCHYVRGVHGTRPQPPVDDAPTLTHSSRRSIIAAGAISNTAAPMEHWLLNPDTIKPGVHMPNVQLSETQARDVSAYLESVR